MDTKKIIFSFLTVVLISCKSTYTPKTASIEKPINLEGVYYSPNKNAKIEFIKKESTYIGKLIWNKEENLFDMKNKNASLRDRKLIGIDLFFALTYKSYLKIWQGQFYDPTSGNTYNCDLWMTNANKTLMARGYLKNAIMNRTESLQRVDNNQ